MSSTIKRLLLRADVWLWARVLPVLAFRRDLPSLLSVACSPTAKPYIGFAPEYVAKHVKRAVRKPWLMRNRQCLREGVLAYRFSRQAGHKPKLHFGIDRNSFDKSLLAAHCWVTVDDEIVLKAPGAEMIEVLVYSLSGFGE